MKTKLLAAAVLLCAASSCAPNEDLDNARSIYEAPAPVLPSAASLSVDSLGGLVPATPAGDALAWTLERLNLSPEAATEDAVRAAFDPSVLEQVAASALASEIQRIGGNRPFALVGFVEAPTDTRIVAAVMNRNGFGKLTVEVGESGRMTTALFEEFGPTEGSAMTPPERSLPLTAPAAPAAAPAEGSGAADAAAVPAEGSAAAEATE